MQIYNTVNLREFFIVLIYIAVKMHADLLHSKSSGIFKKINLDVYDLLLIGNYSWNRAYLNKSAESSANYSHVCEY